jgi:hypothetical protein
MTKADCVHSTPPTNTPIDTTRRRFLAVSAGASVASVGTLAVAAMPAAILTAPPAADPIYAAIELHEKAADVWNAAVDVWAKFPDGPELWVERERIHDAWCDARNALDDTGVDLINTAPSTLAGIARALNYIREQMLNDDGIYMPSGLRLADDTDGEYPVAWIEAFLDTIEGAARELDRAGKAVQS